MKKLLLSTILVIASVFTISAQQVEEKLSRAPIAVKASNGILVSWRSLKGDAEGTSFNVYRNGTKLTTLDKKTNYLDSNGKAGNTYKIETVVNGAVVETNEVKALNNMFKSLKVRRPAPMKDASGSETGYYRPDDASVGDVDGDGEYEIILKWFPSNQRDSGKEGKASPTFMGCYKMDGTELWKQYICFGHNIRSGNHTMQFLVYDFDGDGKAEIICRTAAGTTDGEGKYVSEASDDSTIKATNNTKTYQNSKGYVTGGEEFLTVFNGRTGKAMHTIWYRPNRGLETNPTKAASISSSWGDSYGGRAERFNAAVAYLDGLDHLPYAVMQRGYYTQCFVWAVAWNGKALTTKWLHRGTGKTSWNVTDENEKSAGYGSGKSSYGQGVHGISVADVDNDGCDEICIGSATIDHDGKLLCSTGKGHGDAIHLADLIPDRPGYEVMMPHEDDPYGYDVHDAATGEIIVNATSGEDNGRGLACDFVPRHKGSEFWSSANNMSRCEDGNLIMSSKPDTNFRIYWLGTPFDQTFDGRYDSNTGKCSPRIRYYNTSSNSIKDFITFTSQGAPQTCNTTKATPCLQADLFGDWREEIIMYKDEDDYSNEYCTLMIFSTPEPSNYKVTCLMQDHVYRMGIAWQNSSYNQPPHLGYSLAESLGITRSSAVVNPTNHAPAYTEEKDDPTPTPTPEPDPTEEMSANVDASNHPSADKGTYETEAFIMGENGELTDNTNGNYLKIRTNMNDQIKITVKEGYIITGIKLEGRSNNNSTTADRSIDLTGVYVDGSTSSSLTSTVTLPGGTAGTGPVTAEVKGINASKSVVLTFDNSKITSSDIDSAGKNKQIFAAITITYKKAGTTSVRQIMVKDDNDTIYNLNGQKVSRITTPGIYIKNGKKFIAK